MKKLKVKYIKEKQFRYYALRMLNKLHELGWDFESLHELNALLFTKSDVPNPNRVPSAAFLLVTADYFQGFKVEIAGEISVEIMKKIEALGFQRLEKITGAEQYTYAWYLKIPGGLGIEKKLTNKSLKRKQKQLQNRTLIVADALLEAGWNVKSSWGGTGKPSTLILHKEKNLVPGHYVLLDVSYYGKHPAIELQGHPSIVHLGSMGWLTRDTGLLPPHKVPDPKDGTLLCWAALVPIKIQALTIKGQRKQQNKFRRVYLRFFSKLAKLGWEYRFPYRNALLFFVPNSVKDLYLKFEEEDKLAKTKVESGKVPGGPPPLPGKPPGSSTATEVVKPKDIDPVQLESKSDEHGVNPSPLVVEGNLVVTPEAAVATSVALSEFTTAGYFEPENTDIDPLALLHAAEDFSNEIKNFNQALTIQDELDMNTPNDVFDEKTRRADDDDELNMDWCNDV
eukprot:TRINITY_DN3179_c0_g1_i6.p1 TRINITY_DN3179_c0_g1~~TRINITY_DN3179_c0_g1_i6.p1  ORF type:complete len:452 (+),score=114.59 TRINITY_DN3179_c0_g1_i6:72-1427(+)